MFILVPISLKMIVINNFIKHFSSVFGDQASRMPWEIINTIIPIIEDFILKLNDEFQIKDGVAIHKTAVIETGAVLKGPLVIEQNCFVGANAYLRGGVYLGKSVKIGPGCEIKSSIIFNDSRIAHFNFIADSLIGNNANFEAGALTANHYNERVNKLISVIYRSTIIETNTEKFGSLVGDNSRIGANAVLSPGTILNANTVVNRLELIDQVNNN